MGPTASGKSSASFALAQEFGLEIVTADSMQVYRGLDVGTAKPSAEEQRLVPHHLIDVVSPEERFTVARFVQLAEEAIDQVFARGATPLVAGGTGFYLRALREGVPTAPQADTERQAPIWQEVESGRLPELIEELRAASPQDADRAAGNPRRVVRSVEVLRATGRPPSAFPFTTPRFRYEVFLLDPPPDVLRHRIERRAHRQLEEGLLDEARELLYRHGDAPTAIQAIGYKELFPYLLGDATLAEVTAALVDATARYAKRQRTWFRREPNVHRLEMTGEEALPTLRRMMQEHGLV